MKELSKTLVYVSMNTKNFHPGTLIYFSTQFRKPSTESKNGVFTLSFLNALYAAPERDHEALFDMIWENMRKNKNLQAPSIVNNLSGPFVFFSTAKTRQARQQVQVFSSIFFFFSYYY